MSILQIVTLVLGALLGLFTAYAAYSLFTSTPPSVAKMREALHFPRWYWVLAGFVATFGAIGLLAGLVFPTVGALAALWMIAYFVVATFTHLVRKDFANLGMPALFLAIFVGLLVLRWSDVTPLLVLVRR
jgi:DoxX-like protein